MPRTASKIEATLQGKNLLQWEQIISFKSSPYGKEAKYFMLILLYYKYFLTNVTHIIECYAYEYMLLALTRSASPRRF